MNPSHSHCPTCSCPPNRSFPAFTETLPTSLALAEQTGQLGMMVIQPNDEGYEATIYHLPRANTPYPAVTGMEVLTRGQYNTDGALIRELPRVD